MILLIWELIYRFISYIEIPTDQTDKWPHGPYKVFWMDVQQSLCYSRWKRKWVVLPHKNVDNSIKITHWCLRGWKCKVYSAGSGSQWKWRWRLDEFLCLSVLMWILWNAIFWMFELGLNNIPKENRQACMFMFFQ